MQETSSVSWGMTGISLIALALLPLLVFALIVRPKLVLAFLGVGAVLFIGVRGLAYVRQGFPVGSVANIEWQTATIIQEIPGPTPMATLGPTLGPIMPSPLGEQRASSLLGGPLPASTINNPTGPVSAIKPENENVHPLVETDGNAELGSKKLASLEAEYADWLVKQLPFPNGYEGTILQSGWYSSVEECEQDLLRKEREFLVGRATTMLAATGRPELAEQSLPRLDSFQQNSVHRNKFSQTRQQAFGTFEAPVHRVAWSSYWDLSQIRGIPTAGISRSRSTPMKSTEVIVLLGGGLAGITGLLLVIGFACQVRARAAREASAASQQ